MSGVRMHTNLKAMGKELLGASLNIYKVAGYSIAKGIWKEFEQLVNETAQYTGTTAASWNLSAGGFLSTGGVRTMPKRNKENALRSGHQYAVDVALVNNYGRITGSNIYDLVLRSGINVWNEAPGAMSGVVETGPLRDVNTSSLGAFSRFQNRIETKVFNPIPFKLGMKDFNIMAESLAKTKGF